MVAARTKKIAIGVGVFVALAVVGIVVGVVVSENNRKAAENDDSSANANGNSSSSDSRSSRPSATTTADGSNPTYTVTPEAGLHKSFYGIAYTPPGAIPPACGANIEEVRRDVARLSQLTPRVRLYGSDCNVTSLVLQAVNDLNVDLQVYPAIFLETTEPSYISQKTALEDALVTYGIDHVAGVSVGNEYVLVSIQNGTDSAAATDRLVEKINEVRTDLVALGFDVPVGTSDAGGTIPQLLADNSDYVFANIHPWFAQVTVEESATWANTFFQDTIIPLGTASPRNPVMWQGEMGWPDAADDTASSLSAGGSAASIANLQTMLDDWVCPMNDLAVPYFWFSFQDELWKAANGGVEAHWGLFDVDGNLKDITIPNCVLP